MKWLMFLATVVLFCWGVATFGDEPVTPVPPVPTVDQEKEAVWQIIVSIDAQIVNLQSQQRFLLALLELDPSGSNAPVLIAQIEAIQIQVDALQAERYGWYLKWLGM